VNLKRRVKCRSWLILRLLARRLRERAIENEENFSENKPAELIQDISYIRVL